MTAHSELVARPALRHLAFLIAHSFSTGVLAGAAMSIYWNTLPGTINWAQFAIGLAIMFSVLFILRAKEPQPDGEKT